MSRYVNQGRHISSLDNIFCFYQLKNFRKIHMSNTIINDVPKMDLIFAQMYQKSSEVFIKILCWWKHFADLGSEILLNLLLVVMNIFITIWNGLFSFPAHTIIELWNNNSNFILWSSIIIELSSFWIFHYLILNKLYLITKALLFSRLMWNL